MAWRSRSWDLRASAIAASASARLRRTSSRPASARVHAKRGLRAFRPARASPPCFPCLAFRNPKLNFTRLGHARRPQALGQVSEKKVILPQTTSRAVPPAASLRAAAHGSRRRRSGPGAAIKDRSGAKLRARLNQFRNRAQIHASRERSSLRARILVNAGYGYRTLKKLRARDCFGSAQRAGGRLEAPSLTLMRHWAIRTSA